MGHGVRWLIALALVLLAIGLIAYARGPEHHRGDDVGALGSGAAPATFGSREAAA
jgi:hypothetical protein